MGPDGFALLLSGSHPISLHGLSRFFEGSPEELARRIPKIPVTLMKGLPLKEAHRLSNDLGRHGVTVVILPAQACSRYPHAGLALRPSPEAQAEAPARKGTSGVRSA